MNLFSRTVVLQGSIADTTAAAADLRAYVSDKLGNEVGLWGAMLGAPLGSMSFTATVDGLAGAAAMNEILMADEGYHAKADTMRQYMVAPAETVMMSLIHGELGEGRPPVGAVATVTTAVAAGAFDQAAGWGVELAQLAESVTGMPVMFGNGLAGTFGEFAWIGITADAAAADAANEALLGNADYIAKISGATELFVPGAAHRIITTRVA